MSAPFFLRLLCFSLMCACLVSAQLGLLNVRKVRVTADNCNTLTQVSVFTCGPTATDVAKLKPTSKIGDCTYDGCGCNDCPTRVPSRAVSGALSTCTTSRPQSFCTAGAAAVWQVDLGADYEICTVDVYQGIVTWPMSITFYDSADSVLYTSAKSAPVYSFRAECGRTSCALTTVACAACDQSDCSNQATTISGVRPQCNCGCNSGFSGIACQFALCDATDCNPAGTRSISGGRPNCQCTCHHNYTGARCEHTRTPTLSTSSSPSSLGSSTASFSRTVSKSRSLTDEGSSSRTRGTDSKFASNSPSNVISSSETPTLSATPVLTRSGSLTLNYTESFSASPTSTDIATSTVTQEQTGTASFSPTALRTTSFSIVRTPTATRNETDSVPSPSVSPTLEDVLFAVDPIEMPLSDLRKLGATVRVSIHGDKFLAGLVGHSPAGCVSLSVGPIPQLGNGTQMAALQRAAELMTADVVVNVTSSGNMTVLLPPENATAPLVSRHRVPLQVVVAARCIGRQELADDERMTFLELLPSDEVTVPDVGPTQQALAITGSVVGATMTPSVAIQATRALFDLSLSTCALEEDELSTLDSPLGYVYGEGRARYYVGGAIGNTLVLGLWLLGHMGVVVACMLWQRRRRVASGAEPLPPRQQFVDGCRAARFPSVVMMPWLLLLQPTVTSGVAGATATDDGFEIAVCAAVLLLWALSPLVLVVVLRPLRQRVELVPSDDAHDPDWRSRYSRFAEGDLMWRDMPEHEAARYLTRYRMLFVEYNARLPQFLAIDSGVSIVMGLISGLRGIMDGKCAALAGVCVSVLLTLLCLIVWIRPYRGQLSFWYALIAVGLQLISATAAFVFLLLKQYKNAKSVQELLTTVIDALVTIQTVITMLRVLLDILARLRRFLRRIRGNARAAVVVTYVGRPQPLEESESCLSLGEAAEEEMCIVPDDGTAGVFDGGGAFHHTDMNEEEGAAFWCDCTDSSDADEDENVQPLENEAYRDYLQRQANRKRHRPTCRLYGSYRPPPPKTHELETHIRNGEDDEATDMDGTALQRTKSSNVLRDPYTQRRMDGLEDSIDEEDILFYDPWENI